MVQSGICDYSDGYILVKGAITFAGVGDDAAAALADGRNKQGIFKYCAPFANCKSEINNMQGDNVRIIDVVMAMQSIIKDSCNYARTSGSLGEYYREEPNDIVTNSESSKVKAKIAGNINCS